MNWDWNQHDTLTVDVGTTSGTAMYSGFPLQPQPGDEYREGRITAIEALSCCCVTYTLSHRQLLTQ